MSAITTDVQHIFSSIATNYDRLNTILTLNIDQIWRKKAVKLCNLENGATVLDLCCGTGKMTELECKEVGENTKVIGLDFNREMLKVAENNLKESLINYELVQGDACFIPFEDSSFNCVTIAFGLRNVPNKTKALAEMYRVLKPGGKVICLELSKPEIPICKNIYNLYFNHILPIIGYLGTQDKEAYFYLRNSVNGFMSKRQLKNEFKKIGFENSGFKSITFGIASIHYGVKPL